MYVQVNGLPKFLYILSIVDLFSLEVKVDGELISCHCDKMPDKNMEGIVVHSVYSFSGRSARSISWVWK